MRIEIWFYKNLHHKNFAKVEFKKVRNKVKNEYENEKQDEEYYKIREYSILNGQNFYITDILSVSREGFALSYTFVYIVQKNLKNRLFYPITIRKFF